MAYTAVEASSILDSYVNSFTSQVATINASELDDASKISQINALRETLKTDIRTVVNGTSAIGSGNITILYSGKLPDGSKPIDVIGEMKNNGENIRIIGDTEAGKLMDRYELKNAIARALLKQPKILYLMKP